jgi:hypothetical protein
MVSAAKRINTQRRPHHVFAPHNRTLPCPVFFLYKPHRPTPLCPATHSTGRNQARGRPNRPNAIGTRISARRPFRVRPPQDLERNEPLTK